MTFFLSGSRRFLVVSVTIDAFESDGKWGQKLWQRMNGKLQNERNDLRAELDEIQDVLDEAEFRAEQLQEQKMMLEEKIAQMKDSFEGKIMIV